MKPKHLLFLLLCSFLAIALSSCHKDDGTDSDLPINNEDNKSDIPMNPTPQPDLTGLLKDGEYISRVGLYCLEYDKVYYDVWFNYYPMVKTVDDYSKMYFVLWLHEENGTNYWNYLDAEEASLYRGMELDYYRAKTAPLVEEMKAAQSEGVKDAGWPDGLMTAYVNGEVTITCDKTLFGEAPGTNLSSHFKMLTQLPFIATGIETPSLLYDFKDEKPDTMNGYFPDSGWLLYRYHMEWLTAPEEKYDEITLTLNMPVIIEHSRKFVVYRYKGLELESKYSEATLTSECRIQFDWK